MTSGNPSAAAAAVRLIVGGLRKRSGETAPAVPRRRLAVERAGIVPDPRKVAPYLRATGAADVSALTGITGSPVPPLYPAVWEGALVLELLGTADLPFPRGGLVHLGGETVHIRSMEVGEPVRCRAELDRIEPAAGGLRLTVRCRNWDAGGRLCTEDSIEILLRTGSDTRPRPTRRPSDEELEVEWETIREWELGAGHGRRYARASGDYNPIHLWPWTSRPFGFRRPILHGFCTSAMVAHALIAERLGGAPCHLRRLEVSFLSPLSLPAVARLLVSDSGGAGRFRVVAAGSARPAAVGAWVGQG